MKKALFTLMVMVGTAQAVEIGAKNDFLYRCDYHTELKNGVSRHLTGHLLALGTGESTSLILSSDYNNFLAARIRSWATDNGVRHITFMIVDPSEPMLPVEGSADLVYPGTNSFGLKASTETQTANLQCRIVN